MKLKTLTKVRRKDIRRLISNRIYYIRNCKAMLDSDLAVLYGVTTKRLNEQVRRNVERFPSDFMFQLSDDESEFLRSQFATLEISGRGKYRKYRPYVFTEQGVAMLSSVLRSQRAIQVNIMIMRTFVRLRKILRTHKEIEEKLKDLEHKWEKHDWTIREIVEAIRALMEDEERKPEKSQREMGFHAGVHKS